MVGCPLPLLPLRADGSGAGNSHSGAAFDWGEIRRSRRPCRAGTHDTAARQDDYAHPCWSADRPLRRQAANGRRRPPRSRKRAHRRLRPYLRDYRRRSADLGHGEEHLDVRAGALCGGHGAPRAARATDERIDGNREHGHGLRSGAGRHSDRLCRRARPLSYARGALHYRVRHLFGPTRLFATDHD